MKYCLPIPGERKKVDRAHAILSQVKHDYFDKAVAIIQKQFNELITTLAGLGGTLGTLAVAPASAGATAE